MRRTASPLLPPTSCLPGRDSRACPRAEQRRPRRCAARRAPRAARAAAPTLPTGRGRAPLLQREQPYDTSQARVPRDVPHEAGGRPHVRRIVGADVARQEKPIAAEPGVDGDVLPAVGTGERDGIPYHTRPHLELPEHGAALRVGRLEPAVQRPVEHQAAGRGEGAAPYGMPLPDLPELLATRGVPSDERAQVAARTG